MLSQEEGLLSGERRFTRSGEGLAERVVAGEILKGVGDVEVNDREDGLFDWVCDGLSGTGDGVPGRRG